MELKLKGINYDTGTEFIAGDITRKQWQLDDVRFDMKAIKNELHCNAVNLYGTDANRLLQAAEIALSSGLVTAVQLRSIDKSKEEMHSAMSAFSQEIARFTEDSIILNIGCESSLFTKGFIPGATFLTRMKNMIWVWPFLPLINKQLSSFLNQLAHEVRHNFPGKVIYGSGTWEEIDWSLFDYIGINLYKDKENERNYADVVKKLGEKAKPVIITEFGCCTFEGASRVGGGGWMIVDYKKEPPQLKKLVNRNEAEQSKLICDSIQLFHENDLYGTFIFDFIETQQLYSPEPKYDLDRASYGIVKAVRADDGAIKWEPKQAFADVARLYQDLN